MNVRHTSHPRTPRRLRRVGQQEQQERQWEAARPKSAKPCSQCGQKDHNQSSPSCPVRGTFAVDVDLRGTTITFVGANGRKKESDRSSTSSRPRSSDTRSQVSKLDMKDMTNREHWQAKNQEVHVCRRTWHSHRHEGDPAHQARRRPKVSSALASTLRSP